MLKTVSANKVRGGKAGYVALVYDPKLAQVVVDKDPTALPKFDVKHFEESIRVTLRSRQDSDRGPLQIQTGDVLVLMDGFREQTGTAMLRCLENLNAPQGFSHFVKKLVVMYDEASMKKRMQSAGSTETDSWKEALGVSLLESIYFVTCEAGLKNAGVRDNRHHQGRTSGRATVVFWFHVKLNVSHLLQATA